MDKLFGGDIPKLLNRFQNKSLAQKTGSLEYKLPKQKLNNISSSFKAIYFVS